MTTRAEERSQAPPRVLHALAVSLPHQNGYTVRSRYIVGTQKETGLAEPLAITSPYYPGNPASIEPAEVGGVQHLRVPHPSDAGWRLGPLDLLGRVFFHLRRSALVLAVHRRLVSMRESRDPVLRSGEEETGSSAEDESAARVSLPRRLAKAVVRPLLRLPPARRAVDSAERWLEALEDRLLRRRFCRAIELAIRDHRVDLVHAHSPYRTALPAIRAARTAGVPVVYEVRGLWEESAVASGRFVRGDTRYRRWRARETEAMRAADAVIAIGEALRDEVVARGVDAGRVFVVPNAVDAERFRPADASDSEPSGGLPSLEALRGTVMGYVGSVRAMEGVDELVRGVAAAYRDGHDVSLLVVGDGPELDALRALAADLGIADRAAFPGRVPHDQVAHYYRRIDLFVVSRPDTLVTRTVTPLKPLEAMALGRTVLVSDLPALRELVSHGETGVTYAAGDPTDLARQAGRLIRDPALAERLAEAGRRWVSEERTWSRSLAVLPEAYRVAREHHRSGAASGT